MTLSVETIAKLRAVAECSNSEQAVAALLPLLREAAPAVVNAAVFSVGPSYKRTLKPIGSHIFDQRAREHHISKRMLHDAFKARNSAMRELTPPPPGARRAMTAVLPVAAGGRLLQVVHVELWTADLPEAWAAMTVVERLLALAAPAFDAHQLRSEMDGLLLGLVKTINAAIGAKDTYTVGHSERVAEYSVAVGAELGLDRDERKLLFVSALCHDIGKLGVPDRVLKKPGLLSADDYEEMKTHPLLGVHLIEHLPTASAIESGIRHHHERFDGSGYPDGLSGVRIPLFARVIAIADAFDAMTSGRVYSGYMTEEAAIDELSAKEDLFDPDVARSFVRAFERGSLGRSTGTSVRNVPPT